MATFLTAILLIELTVTRGNFIISFPTSPILKFSEFRQTSRWGYYYESSWGADNGLLLKEPWYGQTVRGSAYLLVFSTLFWVQGPILLE